MKYRSKIGVWFHLTMLFIIAMCALPIYLGIRHGIDSAFYIGIVIDIIVFPFCLAMYVNTYYTLEETTLHIRCGFISARVAYKDITAIYETKDPGASAGLSLDRISINTTKSEWLISPKNKQEFIRLLNEKIDKYSQPEG